MKINLMLPTRQRPDLCRRFCQSIIDTAANLDNIVVSILCDKDDLSYSELQERLRGFTFIQWLPRADVSEFPGLTWYWDQIIKQTMDSSDIYGMVADDMVFRDFGWDKVVLEFFNMLPDRIGLIHFNSDSPHGPDLCIKSFIHKCYIELCGSYNDIRLKGDFSDDFLYYIFNSIDRLCYSPNIVIEHLHYDWGKMEKDPTAERRRAVGFCTHDGMSVSEFYQAHSIPLANKYIEILKSNLAPVQGRKKGLSRCVAPETMVFTLGTKRRKKKPSGLVEYACYLADRFFN